MVYRSPTGLPRLDLILGAETDDPAAARAAFTYGTDDFFANAFDASTAGNKSGVQLNAAETDEQRQREEDEWDSFREGMAELAYLQEQITIGGVSLTVAEHGRLGKRLTEDAAFRAAIAAQMKKDNPKLTDAQISNAMNKYSEFADLLNIPPAKRTDEQNERLHQLQSDSDISPVIQSAKKYSETLNVQRETAVENNSASTSFEGAGMLEVGIATASFANDAAPVASQTYAPTVSTTEPAPTTRSNLRSAFTAASNDAPAMTKPQDLALAADAATVVQQQYVVSASI